MLFCIGVGLIEEYDSPTTLLEDKSSSFAKLVAEYTMRSNSNFWEICWSQIPSEIKTSWWRRKFWGRGEVSY